MIKSVILNRLTDGLVLCESNQGYMDEKILTIKHKVKKYHSQVTCYTKGDSTPLKNIEYPTAGIFFKVKNRVIFTIIVEQGYPLKLVNAFLQSLINPFFDQAKVVLGSTNFESRLESIESDHYFIKFDRIIKQKKKEYEDPSSMKNIDRMKKELDNITDIMKENMNMLDGRQNDLERTGEKARKINQQSKKFQQGTKKLVWHYWFKKNSIWLVLGLLIIFLFYLIF